MGRHTAPAGRRPAPQETEAPSRPAHPPGAHRATSRRATSRRRVAVVPPSPEPPAEAAPRPVGRHRSKPAPRSGRARTSRPAPRRARRRVARPERQQAQQGGIAVIDRVPEEPAHKARLWRSRLVDRVAALPRVLLDTVAWGGFAAVVALIVIALSDVGVGSAARWGVGLSGIVVLAVAVMALTGTQLDNLSHADPAAGKPD